MSKFGDQKRGNNSTFVAERGVERGLPQVSKSLGADQASRVAMEA